MIANHAFLMTSTFYYEFRFCDTIGLFFAPLDFATIFGSMTLLRIFNCQSTGPNNVFFNLEITVFICDFFLVLMFHTIQDMKYSYFSTTYFQICKYPKQKMPTTNIR